MRDVERDMAFLVRYHMQIAEAQWCSRWGLLSGAWQEMWLLVRLGFEGLRNTMAKEPANVSLLLLEVAKRTALAKKEF